MKKRTALLLLVVFVIPSLVLAQATNQVKLRYDFQYLFKWATDWKQITIDSQKPLPKVVWMSGDELQTFWEKLHRKNESGAIGRHTNIVNAFYWPAEITIFLRNDIPSDEQSTEGVIVHELIHYFQHTYQGFDGLSLEREMEAQGAQEQFCREYSFFVPGNY